MHKDTNAHTQLQKLSVKDVSRTSENHIITDIDVFIRRDRFLVCLHAFIYDATAA